MSTHPSQTYLQAAKNKLSYKTNLIQKAGSSAQQVDTKVKEL